MVGIYLWDFCSNSADCGVNNSGLGVATLQQKRRGAKNWNCRNRLVDCGTPLQSPIGLWRWGHTVVSMEYHGTTQR